MIIIPAIDLKAGQCVRLFQGNFGDVTEYSDDPAALAQEFADMGFRYIHVVDLDGAKAGSQQNQESIRAICAATSMSVQLGGGIRQVETLKQWFGNGVERCVIGSLAVTDRDAVSGWLGDYSPDRLVLALDVRIDANGVPLLATHGWTQTSATVLWECIEHYVSVGLTHVLCTDVSRDGALAGPNLDLYVEFARRYPDVRLQASGGVRDIKDLEATARTGASAAISGRALLDGRISPMEIASFRQNA